MIQKHHNNGNFWALIMYYGYTEENQVKNTTNFVLPLQVPVNQQLLQNKAFSKCNQNQAILYLILKKYKTNPSKS